MKQVIDYKGYNYRTQFWEGQNREYEDFCDRLALRRLLPKTTEKFVDICGGYGRLADEYLQRFSDCTLFDYSEDLLKEADQKYAGKLKTVQGSLYELPFADKQFSAAMMIRASHHFNDFKSAFVQLARVVKPKGLLVIEIANKRNVLEIVRLLLGKSNMAPFSLEPRSRNEKGFYNYHPQYVENLFKENNFKIVRVLSVSNFRNNLLKKLFGFKILSQLESLAQIVLGPLKLSPSIYYLLEKKDA